MKYQEKEMEKKVFSDFETMEEWLRYCVGDRVYGRDIDAPYYVPCTWDNEPHFLWSANGTTLAIVNEEGQSEDCPPGMLQLMLGASQIWKMRTKRYATLNGDCLPADAIKHLDEALKYSLMRLAEKGAPKPSSRSELGKALKRFTTKKEK